MKQIPGQGKHVEYLFQDSLDSNLKWKSDCDLEHPLKKVCDFIAKTFKNTNKNQEFNLGEKLAPLSQAPYGLYQSYAGMSMVAFAMRSYVRQIFDLNGKPREARHIVDDVCEIFKSWEDGKKSNKLNFVFESKESSDLCKRFIDTFKLRQLPNYKDVSSLTDARWAVLEYCNRKRYPLWSLKYAGCEEALQNLIDNIVKICDPNGLANQELIGETTKAMKAYELDFNLLLIEPDVFKKGFLEFLKQEEKVKLQDDELDSVYDYLLKHLHGEIGRWSESEVKLQELYWRMEQNTGGNEGYNGGDGGCDPNEVRESNEDDGYPQKNDVVNHHRDEVKKRKINANDAISKADADFMRKILQRLIDKENREVIDTILGYVQ